MHNTLKATLLASALMVSGIASGQESFSGWLLDINREKEIKPVENKAWNDECGSCHLAYQPGLLPSASWEKLLNAKALANHFGDDASLDDDTLRELHDYAINNAAEKSFHKRSRKIALATAQGEAPLRITEIRYIKRKHHEIPDKMIKGNKDVKSLSQCNTCHRKASQGIYDSDTVSIPNYPDWED